MTPPERPFPDPILPDELPQGGSPPGESCASSHRPPNWTIEWDGREGLAFDAYATGLRAPYLQRVTTTGATVLWRVNPPGPLSDLTHPLTRLVGGAPLALHFDGAGYLGYQERELGINLGWSEVPLAQWELRGTPDALAKGGPLALWNRAASDYLVYGPRRWGIHLRWQEAPQLPVPTEWRLEGTLPRVRLVNLRRRGPAALLFQDRPYGVDLGWGEPPDGHNLHLERLLLDASLTFAPQGTDLADGKVLTAREGGIHVSEVSWTYSYRRGLSPGREAEPRAPHLRLRSLLHRPTLQCEALLAGLRPGRRYHYSVSCVAAAPWAPGPDASDDPAAELLLAEDVTFRTAPPVSHPGPVRWLAMGDLGPGKWQPSYCYDVCDLMSEVVRSQAPHLWLPLGDIDNDTNGHPNAVDPFFFNLYNAHRRRGSPRTTAPGALGKPTSVKAFGNPSYFGLLGGLPTFPTFGNHDVCSENGGSSGRLRQAYLGSFALPGAESAWCPQAREFNATGRGLYYTFRWGRVIFISLGLPMIRGCEVASGEGWSESWGQRQREATERLLTGLASVIAQPDVWLVAFFHDHHCAIDPPGETDFPLLLLRHGVDLAITGHRHTFEAHDIFDGGRHMRSLVVGTGGYGDLDPGDSCRRPGFVMLEVEGDTLRYWKYDTHRCAQAGSPGLAEGTPLSRESRQWQIREHCLMRKTGPSAHEILLESDLHWPVAASP